jgi:two-component system cell cycle response regulator
MGTPGRARAVRFEERAISAILSTPVTPPAKILVVDDSQAQREKLAQVLRAEGYEVLEARDAKEAIKSVKASQPDLVLLDMILPDMDGREVLRLIKPRDSDQFMPVIILSMKGDVATKVEGLRIGADDFLVKGVEDPEIIARCQAMLRIKSLQERLREMQRKLEEQSITDPLTGLRNRRFFDERLHEEFRRAQRYGDYLSLIMVDLDHFKQVNDRFGHPEGDAVLRESAGLIRASLRDPDICARYGGEEFAVILPKTHMSGALAVAERIWRAIGAKDFVVGPGETGRAPRTTKVTASIGVAFYPSKDINTCDLLLRFADQALYQAKRSGRNTICLYQVAPYRYETEKS